MTPPLSDKDEFMRQVVRHHDGLFRLWTHCVDVLPLMAVFELERFEIHVSQMENLTSVMLALSQTERLKR